MQFIEITIISTVLLLLNPAILLQLLVVQEKNGRLRGTGIWKIPTGVIDQVLVSAEACYLGKITCLLGVFNWYRFTGGGYFWRCYKRSKRRNTSNASCKLKTQHSFFRFTFLSWGVSFLQIDTEFVELLAFRYDYRKYFVLICLFNLFIHVTRFI